MRASVAQVGGRPAKADVIRRFPPPRVFLWFMLPIAFMSVFFLVLSLVAAGEGSPGGALLVFVAAVAFGSMAVAIMPFCVIPALLTATELATPRWLRSWTVVPLAEVAGVGLLYTSAGRASG